MNVSRRRFLATVGAGGAALAFDRWLGAQTSSGLPGGRLVRTVPLGRFDGRGQPSLNTLLGTGLDARQFSDLSVLDVGHLSIPTEHFYIRTAHPAALPPADAWQIAIGGMVRQPRALAVAALREQARDVGTHVMECSGNSDPANFGLLSAAAWHGVPIAEILDRADATSGATRVRITGIDDESVRSVTSIPGASWVFTLDDLERRGAFLAVGMNGGPLPLDHGAPVRLVIPNYYGCSCIKWLSRIDWVGDDEPATSQMREFSARTHQDGVPALAREYASPEIQLAAMPVRVEQWIDSASRTVYRIVGIRWGGTVTRPPLTIRFKHTEPFVPVDDVSASPSPTTWSLWTHLWRPEGPGRYEIALNVADRAIPARRLDLFFYTRQVNIEQV